MYICECGKTFSTSNSFNGHKSHCKEHFLCKYGDLYLYEFNKEKNSANLLSALRHKSEQISISKKYELNNWIAEQHKCENCGKIMTEYFGSGRFCSRSCANSRNHTPGTKEKISKSLLGHVCKEATRKKISTATKGKKLEDRVKYNGPELPILEIEQLNPGYFPRTRLSYAEKFWKTVLDNNNISYIHDFKVLKNNHTPGCYKLDFLVENIDIEIDGSQHEYTVEKDKIRTAYLESLGYKVYRIPWVNPYNNYNKTIVNNQINDLFDYLINELLVNKDM